jgi:hypothetical protein
VATDANGRGIGPSLAWRVNEGPLTNAGKPLAVSHIGRLVEFFEAARKKSQALWATACRRGRREVPPLLLATAAG